MVYAVQIKEGNAIRAYREFDSEAQAYDYLNADLEVRMEAYAMADIYGQTSHTCHVETAQDGEFCYILATISRREE